MKKYLFIALAALGFAACAEKDEMGKQPIQNGEKEQSYVAVTFTADGVTRADQEGNFEVGTTAERAVKSAYVFFFYENGDAFTVTGKTSHPGGVNYVDVIDQINKTTNNSEGDAMENVSDIKDTVLVLENYKGEYPSQVVAVINWTPDSTKPADYYSLSQLKKEISTLGNDTDGYVMSNSVYLNANNEIVDAVALTENNIVKVKEEAYKYPVVIHVERIAAKVDYPADKNDDLFDIDRTIVDTVESDNGTPAETKVYAKIVGFELYNDYEESRLIKMINTDWGLTSVELGFNWNNVAAYRSYWATSLDTAFPENTFAWGSDNTPVGKFDYVGENTRAWDEKNDVRTKVIVKAKLVDEDENPVEVVSWWGKEYVGVDHLKIVVANTLVNTYYTLDETNSTLEKKIYVGLTPDDIECEQRKPGEKNAYEVLFVISQNSKGKKWFKYENNDYKEISLDALNAELKANVQPALVYNDGMTYYYTNIKHLGEVAGCTAEYGVVRNHIYSVNISGITGYGTPVFNKDYQFETPEKPKDIETFVSAQINILSWRVVDNTTTLQ